METKCLKDCAVTGAHCHTSLHNSKEGELLGGRQEYEVQLGPHRKGPAYAPQAIRKMNQ